MSGAMATEEIAVEGLQEAVGVLSSKWAVAVLSELADGTHRFNELLRHIDGASRRMLAVTLRRLEEHDLVERRIYADVPVRVEDDLSPAGEDLFAALAPLAGWGLQHPLREPASRSVRQSAGALSSRQRSTLVPWRMRLFDVWSNVTSTTSSGRSSIHSRSRSLFQRLGSPWPRSPVSYGASLAGSSRFCLMLKPDVWPTGRSLPSGSCRPRMSEPTVPSSLPGRQPMTTASIVRTRLILLMPTRSPGR